MSNYVKKIHPPDISRFPYGDWLPCVRNHSGTVFFVTFPPHLRYISITNTFYFPIFTPGPYECGRKKGFRATPFAPCIQARPADLMKMKNTVRQSIILGMVGTAVYFCVGCSAKQDTSKSTAPVEVFLNATAQQEPAASLAPGTKTIIGGDRLDKVFWSERDTISVYWRASGSADALNSGQRFHCYQYSPSVSTFATQMNVMAPGSYDYYAAFPRPAAVSGTQVSYDLPALQDGTYDMRSGQSYSAPYTGNLDYMLAEPLTGRPGLASDNAMTMNFIHQCHVMRIQVPTGRNRWGRPIRKLRVEFPSPVVGRMTMDLTAPTAAPSLSDGSNTVTAELRQSFDESAEDAYDGKYVWLFLCPGTINGTVRFIAYDEDGNRITSISQQINRKLEAGRITPVNLTIPGSLSITRLTFSIAGNNLGETPNTFTVKAAVQRRIEHAKLHGQCRQQLRRELLQPDQRSQPQRADPHRRTDLHLRFEQGHRLRNAAGRLYRGGFRGRRADRALPLFRGFRERFGQRFACGRQGRLGLRHGRRRTARLDRVEVENRRQHLSGNSHVCRTYDKSWKLG